MHVSTQTDHGWAQVWYSADEFAVQWPGSSVVHYFTRDELARVVAMLEEIIR